MHQHAYYTLHTYAHEVDRVKAYLYGHTTVKKVSAPNHHGEVVLTLVTTAPADRLEYLVQYQRDRLASGWLFTSPIVVTPAD